MTQDQGFQVFDPDPQTLAWVKVAHSKAVEISADPEIRAANLRHGGTWFVGVDALPNAADGSIAGVPLKGPWEQHIPQTQEWHRAQLSIVYPGYPRQDTDESDANHRYRIIRQAAHVDGLLPVGPNRRRYLREPHVFILGLPLTASDAAPLTVWPGSHIVMGRSFRAATAGKDPTQVDLTQIYHAARQRCFDDIEPVALVAEPGQSILLHRHLLHGVAPWAQSQSAPGAGRMIAYFRPQQLAKDWLIEDG